MKNDWPTNQGFWFQAITSAVTLAGLIIVVGAASITSTIPGGRTARVMIEVMRSRTLGGPSMGYYERLFNAAAAPGETALPNHIVDHGFRMFRMKPNLNWRPDGVTTNSFGLIGRQCSQAKPPNTRRVALLGDSIAQGLGVESSQAFGALLEDRLNATRPNGTSQRFEILNFSVNAYRLTQILDVAVEDAPRFAPDVYVLALSAQSVTRAWDKHLVQLIRGGIDLKYDFLRETVRRAGAAKDDDRPTLSGELAPFRIPVLRDTLAEMKSRAAHVRASFIVVLIPSVEESGISSEQFRGIPELLASLDVPTIDVLDTFDESPDFKALRIDPSDVHPNARGHAMILENLYGKLRAQPAAWRALVGDGVESLSGVSPPDGSL